MGSGREAAHDDVVLLLAVKDAEIAAVREENTALLARVTELEGLVAALHAQLGRDSSNSGRPPSSDSPFTKKPAAKRSVRTRSGKPRGKQPGASSATLRLIDDPDDTITHTPPVCTGCGVNAHVIPGACAHVIPQVVGPGDVLPCGLVLVVGDTPGSLVGSVAGSVHEHLVAGVDESIEQGFGDDGVGEQRIPVDG